MKKAEWAGRFTSFYRVTGECAGFARFLDFKKKEFQTANQSRPW